jgi:hypothetical protein
LEPRSALDDRFVDDVLLLGDEAEDEPAGKPLAETDEETSGLVAGDETRLGFSAVDVSVEPP